MMDGGEGEGAGSKRASSSHRLFIDLIVQPTNHCSHQNNM